MSKNALILAGPKLQKALKDLSAGVKAIDLTPEADPSKRQTLLTRMGNVTGSQSYNGYFTLKDVSTYAEDGTVKEYRVAVCDGETWDPETETSGDSIAYCNGAEIHFPCTVFSIKEAVDIYIKCGAGNKYLNKIVVQKAGSVKPSRLGYEYVKLGSVTLTTYDKQLSIKRLQMTESVAGLLYIPYDQYAGDFCIRLIEDVETDSVIDGKAAVCNGLTWDVAKQYSGGSTCTLNGTDVATGDCSIIDFSYEHNVYLYGYIDRGPKVKVVSTVTTPEMTSELVSGYTLIGHHLRSCPPHGGLYNILLYNVGCDGSYSIVEDTGDSQ